MRKSLNYQKILDLLNEELKNKYSNPELYNKVEEFYDEDSRHYFSLEKNEWGYSEIFFLNYLIYSDSIHRNADETEKEVIAICKEWFNNYIDTLYMLKF